jgi:hypothetical protein
MPLSMARGDPFTEVEANRVIPLQSLSHTPTKLVAAWIDCEPSPAAV